MIAVSKSLGATVANGALLLAVVNTVTDGTNPTGGVLFDPFAASFVILDVNGGTIVAKTALDLVANRLGVGRYAAAWNASAVAVGQYEVVWYYTATSMSAEASFSQEFEVVAKPYASSPYCSVYDLRAEGVTTAMGSDAVVQGWIARAGKYIEQLTGQSFVPVYKTLTLNGRETRALLLGEPIIAMDSVSVDYFTIFGSNTLIIPGETLRVFNRHITGMINPDDRKNPKIEFVHGGDLAGLQFSEQANSGFLLSQLIWPAGVQNIQLAGIFGYTEADGSFVGQTPFLIREAAKLLVVMLMPQMIDQDGRAETAQRDRLIQENTRDQGFQLTAPWLKGGLTGNWQIDSILADFTRPPAMGAA